MQFSRSAVKGLFLGALLLVALSACSATHLPGDPSYHWLNGVWNGITIAGWEQTFKFEVVDGNKIIGWQETRNERLRLTGQGQLAGEFTDQSTIRVTVYRQNVTTYTLKKNPDGNLSNLNDGNTIKKVK